jgi:hypothetical protein
MLHKTSTKYTSFFLLIALILILEGCMPSTTFKPPRDHRVYLALEDGAPALIKDSMVVSITGRPDTLLECDDYAQTVAQRGVKSYKSGQSGLTAAALVYPLVPVIGLIVMANAIADVHTGMAKLIDAMNIHNDQSECLFPTEQAQEKKLERSPELEELIVPFSVKIPYDGSVAILNRQVHVRCSKERESLFFSTITLSFKGIVGIDKNRDGSFNRTSLKVQKGDIFYLRTESLLLQFEVVQETDDGLTLTFKKQ